MSKRSAGILLYRQGSAGVEVFLVHPGGPVWRKKDAGAWSIPKGEYAAEEEGLACARREFEEETGQKLGEGPLTPLGVTQLPSGKVIAAWALQGDCDAASVRSNTFPMEWPPRSGKIQHFPEVDRAGWFGIEEARRKLHPAQGRFLDQLAKLLGPFPA